MYGKIIYLMNDENFYKVPKFLEIAEISPLALYLFSRMIDHYRYHVKHSDNKTHRDLLSLGWFWWTFPDIEKHVGLKKDQARTCLNELEMVLLIEKDTKRVGMEQRCWYRLNEDKIEFYLEKYRILKSEKRNRELENLLPSAVLTTTDGGETASNQELSNQELSNKEKDLKSGAINPAPSFNAVKYFFDKYLEYRQVKYVMTDNKAEAGILTTLCKKTGEDEYKRAIEAFHKSTDKFHTGGWTSYNLAKHINIWLAVVIDPNADNRIFLVKNNHYYVLNEGNDSMMYVKEEWEKDIVKFENKNGKKAVIRYE